MSWAETFDVWRSSCNSLVTYPPVVLHEVEKLKVDIPDIPQELLSLYLASNGLRIGTAQVLPAEAKSSVKRTWDSIQRANSPSTSRFFDGDPDFFSRFIVFAEIGAGEAAVFDRTDGSIWYENEEHLKMTSFTLQDFLQALVKEAAEGII